MTDHLLDVLSAGLVGVCVVVLRYLLRQMVLELRELAAIWVRSAMQASQHERDPWCSGQCERTFESSDEP